MSHILVVDDDIYIGNLLQEALESEGYRVSRAYSGTEAVLALERGRPDLILLDLMLPGLSGEAVLPKLAGVPVIVVSAKADVDSKAALLLGGYWGGLAGAVGMTIGDFTTSYVTSAPKTFLLKLCIGLIVGLVAHKIFKLSREHSARYVTGVTILACVCGMGFNVVADPLVGYFYKTYLFGIPQDVTQVLVKISALTTSVNAVVAVVAASVIYLALRPALKKADLFVEMD